MNGAKRIASWVEKLLKSRWYPAILRWPILLFFVFLVYELLFGAPKRANLGIALVWFIWWPILPLAFLLAGRFWCAVCPFATVSDLVRSLVGVKRRVPGFLRRNGVWVIDLLFIGLIFVEFLVGIVLSPRATAVLLLTIATMAVVSGAFFERRTWCRYMCPLGGMASIFSRLGMLELKTNAANCAKCDSVACYQGGEAAPGCPMFLCARTAEGNPACNFCGNCLKNCPEGSIQVAVRPPLRGLWAINRPRFEEALIAAVFVGIGLSLNIMLKKQDWVQGFLGFQDINVSLPLFYAVMLLLPCLVLYLASRWAGRITGQPTRVNFTHFGYFLVPLAFVNQAALATIHELLASAKLVYFNLLPLFGGVRPTGYPGLLSENVIRLIQVVALAGGVVASAYIAYRIARQRFIARGPWAAATPFLVMLALIVPFNLSFYLPSREGPAERLPDRTARQGAIRPGEIPVVYREPSLDQAPVASRLAVNAGYRILTESSSQLAGLTGNQMSCSNCHFGGGISNGGQDRGISLVGSASPYLRADGTVGPELAAKINECLRVNLLGRPFSPGDPRLRQVIDYLVYLSSGVPAGVKAPWLGLPPLSGGGTPDKSAGQALYAEHCSMCHRIDGSGTEGAPALAGSGAFSRNSAMARLELLAAFNQLNMPLGVERRFTVQEALDISAYILSLPRPAAP